MKHFIETSVLRQISSPSTVIDSYYSKELTGGKYLCSYVRMEFIRGFIIPAINFYGCLNMPNIRTISDAMSFWSNHFKTGELKAVNQVYRNLFKGRQFDIDSDKDKYTAMNHLADYIK